MKRNILCDDKNQHGKNLCVCVVNLLVHKVGGIFFQLLMHAQSAHSTQKALFFSQLRSRGFLKKNQTALLSPGDKKVRRFHVLVFLLF